MSKTTTAIVIKEKAAPPVLEEVTLNDIQADEALIEIEAVGVCHTDLACIDGSLPAQFPSIFGHEGAGVVKEVGSNITHVAPGDKVLLSYAHCGGCTQCKNRLQPYCDTFVPANFGGVRTTDGTSAVKYKDEKCFAHFFGQSSFMRLAVAHKSSIVKVPADTDLALYAPLGCGMQTGSGCMINTLGVTEGSSVAVFGVGAVGLAAVMGAKLQKAKTIIAIDLHQSRLDIAKEVGATHTLRGDAPDLVDQVKKICPPTGVNFAADCTGVLKVVETMIQCLGIKGKGATVGAPPPGATVAVDPFTHLIMGRSYVGCTEGDAVTSEFIPYMIEQHKAGNFPLDKFVKYYDVKDVDQAFKDSLSGKTVKAVLKW